MLEMSKQLYLQHNFVIFSSTFHFCKKDLPDDTERSSDFYLIRAGCREIFINKPWHTLLLHFLKQSIVIYYCGPNLALFFDKLTYLCTFWGKLTFNWCKYWCKI